MQSFGGCTTDSSGTCTLQVPANSTTPLQVVAPLGFGVTITKNITVSVAHQDVSAHFTFKNFAQLASEGTNSGTVTIIGPQDSVVTGQSISPLETASLPQGAVNLIGQLTYLVDSITVGSTINVTFALPSGASANRVAKPLTNGGFLDLTPYSSFNSESNTVTVQYTDGGEGDADGIANGAISDPIVFLNFSGTLPSGSQSSNNVSSGGSSAPTPSPTPTPTPSATPSPSASPSPVVTPTASPSATPMPMSSPTPSVTQAPLPMPTPTQLAASGVANTKTLGDGISELGVKAQASAIKASVGQLSSKVQRLLK